VPTFASTAVKVGTAQVRLCPPYESDGRPLVPPPSCPGLTRASTSSFRMAAKTWMAGTSPAMTTTTVSCH